MEYLRPPRFRQSRRPARGSSTRGFTLVELLVVLGVIALIMALLLPSLKRAREASRRTACTSNLRQIAAAMTLYSNTYGQQIPAHQTATPGSQMLWEVPIALRDDLLKNGLLRKIFYCPANMDQNTDANWTANTDWSVMGYFFFIRRLAWPAGKNGLDREYATGDPHHDQGQLYFPTVQGAHRPSESELVSDAVVATGGNFNTAPQAPGTATNHMSGNMPSGGNIAFHDGHVEWRPFANMQKRLSAPDQYW